MLNVLPPLSLYPLTDLSQKYNWRLPNICLQIVWILALLGSLLYTSALMACSYSIEPSQSLFDFNAKTNNLVTIKASTGCQWLANSNTEWITIDFGNNGQGNGTLSYSVTQNTSSQTRYGTLTIAGRTFTITQSGIDCSNSISIAPTSHTHSWKRETGSVTVNALFGCKWNASSHISWANITGGGSGQGYGKVTYSVMENPGTQARSGTFTIAGQTFTITQEKWTDCHYNLTPISQSHHFNADTGSVSVSASSADCQWTASSHTDWLNINSGHNGQGNGTVTYSVTANTHSSSRSGTLTIANQTVSITQQKKPDCTYNITPNSRSHSEEADSGTVNISAPMGCQWLANSHASWITIKFGDKGEGDGTLTYSVTKNTSTKKRIGTLTIAGQTMTLTQNSQDCRYSIMPSGRSHSPNAETGNVTVDAPLGCKWNASSSVTWANITKGGSGEGHNTVTYSVEANSSQYRRTGTLTIAGQYFRLSQATDYVNPAPVIEVFSITPSSGQASLIVNLYARAYDANGHIAGYAWSASDGQTASGETASLTFTRVGTYPITLTVTDNEGAKTTQTKSVTVETPTTRLINISTRAPIQGGANDIIAGFILSGTGSQKVMIRGWNLEAGVDPYLKLQQFPSGDPLGSNNDWQADPYWSGIPTQMRLPNSTDAGLLRTLPVNAYTAILSSVGAKGLGLVGVDVIEAPGSTAKLINLSTRAPIQGGAYDIIAGFIITGTGNQKLVIRAWGLEAGVDPFLTLQKFPSGEFVASNNNWLDDPRAPEIPASMVMPKRIDAALLLDLPAGAYTAILSSVGTKGLGLIAVDVID